MGLLDSIETPKDVRSLNEDQLEELCLDLRQFLINSILDSGGHFSANLGTVELTVALHYVFNTPDDALIWDVGHQAYGHKVLTGRKEQLRDIRKKGGLSGFPNRFESNWDKFGTGHSSTSLSAGQGIAEANLLKGNSKQTITVIGDGSLTAGMAWEAFNNLGLSDSNMLAIINDNQMGIDPNDGAFSRYLSRSEEGNNNLFEQLGLSYSGPIDGHDVNALVQELKRQKRLKGPRILHVRTLKGKGYAAAEKEQTEWHAVKYVKIRGEEHKVYSGPKYQKIFGQKLLQLADSNGAVVGVTPAMPSGCSMDIMMDKYPDRVFDVGIAEQHAVTFSAGLAVEGLIPFCNIYSSFFQRAYDQFIHDVCLQDIAVVFCLDRAGVVGEDGATHHGLYDIPFLRVIPNVQIIAPSSKATLEMAMDLAMKQKRHPIVIRYPRGNSPEKVSVPQDLEMGKAHVVHEEGEIVILNLGSQLYEAQKAIEQIRKDTGKNVALIDVLFLKPLDRSMIQTVFSTYKKILTIEDGTIKGGFYSLICEEAIEADYKGKIVGLGYPDIVVEHASRVELLHDFGLDRDGILNSLQKINQL